MSFRICQGLIGVAFLDNEDFLVWANNYNADLISLISSVIFIYLSVDLFIENVFKRIPRRYQQAVSNLE